MGKNKARHILHGVLDCLPIILIPIFMIYSQNHEINDNSITINESYWEVQNKYETNQITNIATDLVNGNIYKINLLSDNDFQSFMNFLNQEGGLYITYIYWDNSEVISTYDSEYNMIWLAPNNVVSFYVSYDDSSPYMNIYKGDVDEIYLVTQNWYNLRQTLDEEHVNIQASDYIPQENVYHENTPVVYDDTDIMSQSFYCLYNSVDKYFNMGNVFGMKNLYTWFETNIFGGTASPSIYIVWNIVLYEFVMDLLFLLYGLFMFFIDLCKRLMEKPLNSIK